LEKTAGETARVSVRRGTQGVVSLEARKIDITKHSLVPPFSKLKPEEARELLEKYNASLTQLPSILVSDPMARAMGAKPDEIIRIERKTATGKSFYFRRVVA
jgi:DNA-directed RNA polymerase subunit H